MRVEKSVKKMLSVGVICVVTYMQSTQSCTYVVYVVLCVYIVHVVLVYVVLCMCSPCRSYGYAVLCSPSVCVVQVVNRYVQFVQSIRTCNPCVVCLYMQSVQVVCMCSPVGPSVGRAGFGSWSRSQQYCSWLTRLWARSRPVTFHRVIHAWSPYLEKDIACLEGVQRRATMLDRKSTRLNSSHRL